MNIVEATKGYEAWADKHVDLIARDIRLKHQEMAGGAFSFMRATFYRWAMIWREICPELGDAPALLAVGDLHVENFGTWRDGEGRLVWGVNDFDEAYAMPYTIDLVRLATSAVLAKKERSLTIGPDAACAAILAGYTETMADGTARAFLLEESHPSLRAMALGEARDPAHFWAKMKKLEPVDAPRPVRKLLKQQLPASTDSLRIVRRIAGLGSLGRPRYLTLAEYGGGMIAREAKAMLPSAYAWATKPQEKQLFCERLSERSSRARDPFLKLKKGWLLRRLGPYCSRIELADLAKKCDELHLLRAMGHETANVHLGTPSAITAVRRDLKRRGAQWLREAAHNMAASILAEWKEWQRTGPR